MQHLDKIFEESARRLAEGTPSEPKGMVKAMTHDGREDILPFLHDVAVVTHNGKLYQAWYNSTDAEICGSSLIRGRFSEDGGKTWSEPFTVIGDIGAAEEHYVPINFFPHDGKLYAIITEMVGKNMTVSLDLYEQQEDPFAKWRKVAKISEGFICNGPPVLMENGNYIAAAWMPMKEESPAFPAILISDGMAIDKPWRCVFLYDPLHPKAIRLRCPETTLYAEGSRITAFTRNDEGPSCVFVSEDFGETWSKPLVNAMDIGNSKIFVGTLSNGKKYCIYNTDRGYFVRTQLVIAIAEAGSDEFTKAYRVLEGDDAEIGRGHIWFYPCAYEDNGNLYVVVTLQEPDYMRSAIMATIPVASL